MSIQEQGLQVDQASSLRQGLDGAKYRLICDAYACMLQMPGVSEFRHASRFQKTLAGLRDWIASETELDPEFVQNSFEAAVGATDRTLSAGNGEVS